MPRPFFHTGKPHIPHSDIFEQSEVEVQTKQTLSDSLRPRGL